MLAFATTSLAVSRRRPFRGYLLSSIFRRVFMASFAMSFGLLPTGIGFSAQHQSRKIAHQCLRQNFFGRPSRVISAKQRVDMNVQTLRPLHSGQRQSVVCNANVYLSVIRLLFSSRPTAVFWAIRAVVVNAIQRVSKRRLAYVSQKIFKIVPSFAQINASLSIPIKSSVFWVIAPLFYGLPQNVNGSLRFAMTTFHAVNVIQWSSKVK